VIQAEVIFLVAGPPVELVTAAAYTIPTDRPRSASDERLTHRVSAFERPAEVKLLAVAPVRPVLGLDRSLARTVGLAPPLGDDAFQSLIATNHGPSYEREAAEAFPDACGRESGS